MSCGGTDLECKDCRLYKTRTQVVPGTGPCDSRIVFIGEAPGKDEDRRGEPFVGRAGRMLDAALEKAGSNRGKVYITNLVKCRPPKNRRPRKDELASCSRYLEAELDEIAPLVVCALGQTAANSILKGRQKMSNLVGKRVTVELAGRKVIVIATYHPAACLYQRTHTRAFQAGIEASLEAARGSRTQRLKY